MGVAGMITAVSSPEISQDERGQLDQIATASPWLIPTTYLLSGRSFDSADAWTARGFAVFQALTDDANLFYRALPPSGWCRQLHGRWLIIRDSAGAIRARIYMRLGRNVRCAYAKFD